MSLKFEGRKFSDYVGGLNQATDQGNTNLVAKEKTMGEVVKVDGNDIALKKDLDENVINTNEIQREIVKNSVSNVNYKSMEGMQVGYSLQSVQTQTTFYCSVKSGTTIDVVATKSSNYFRFGFVTGNPYLGESVSRYEDYGTNSQQTMVRSFTASVDGFFVISMLTEGSSLTITKKNDGIGNDVKNLEDNVVKINDVVFTETNVKEEPDEVWADHYIVSSGNVNAFTSSGIYDVRIKKVEEGENYIVAGKNQIGDARVYAIYSTDVKEQMNASTLLAICTDELYKGTYSLRVSIPSGGKAIVASHYIGGRYAEQTFYKVEVDNVKNALKAFPFRFSLNNGNLLVATKCGEKELVMKLGTGGGNSLFDFRKFGKIELGSNFDEYSMGCFYSSGTDWIAPFQVKALYNKDGDDVGSGSEYDADGFKITFTGGTHQYNNTESGSTPTARMSNLKFFADGLEISKGYGYASNLEIRWTNYIQGYNTKKADGSGREIIKQNMSLSYDGVEWQVKTEVVPLEDVIINLWYGYQMAGIGENLSTHWKYVNGLNRDADKPTSGNNKTIAMIAYGNMCNVEMWLDTSVDLGDRSLCYPDITDSAKKVGTKGYFTIANNPSETNKLIANCSYYLFGKYKFELQTL